MTIALQLPPPPDTCVVCGATEPAVGKFSLTTAKCVGEREAPDDEFPIAEEP